MKDMSIPSRAQRGGTTDQTQVSYKVWLKEWDHGFKSWKDGIMGG